VKRVWVYKLDAPWPNTGRSWQCFKCTDDCARKFADLWKCKYRGIRLFCVAVEK